jgi:hypothetical protein
MTPPRFDDIDPMVPELPRDDVRADGGARTAQSRHRVLSFADDEADAPLVPDLS